MNEWINEQRLPEDMLTSYVNLFCYSLCLVKALGKLIWWMFLATDDDDWYRMSCHLDSSEPNYPLQYIQRFKFAFYIFRFSQIPWTIAKKQTLEA